MIDLVNLPSKPGCYQYFDKDKKMIYIGKAKNLKKRVSSYFTKEHEDNKTRLLVSNITSMDYIITDTEVEALLLESRLIKQYKPKYNIELKHNERYAYIKITNEEVPRVLTARKKDDKSTYFGPFVDGSARSLTIKTLNETFQLRTCKTLPKTVCLNYHIGLCSGPCEGKVTNAEYKAQIERAKKYLKGDAHELVNQLKDEMKLFAKQQQFELAKLRRDQANAIEGLQTKQKVDTTKEFDQDIIAFASDGKRIVYFIFNIIRGIINKKDEFDLELTTSIQTANQQFIMAYYDDKQAPKEIIIPADFVIEDDIDVIQNALSVKTNYNVILNTPKIGDKVKLLELAQTNADYALAGDNPVLIQLKERLNLPSLPTEIECYDISNLGDDYIVAAKISFTYGKPNKDQYRRYRIRWQKEQNDFAAMYEVIKRRFLHVKNGEEKAPDLVIIDGGKGQLGAALQAMKEHELRIPMIGLAKREEEIFCPGLSKPMSTKKDKDAAIRLLMQIRDETHRFVINYHRTIRDKIYEE